MGLNCFSSESVTSRSFWLLFELIGFGQQTLYSFSIDVKAKQSKRGVLRIIRSLYAHHLYSLSSKFTTLAVLRLLISYIVISIIESYHTAA